MGESNNVVSNLAVLLPKTKVERHSKQVSSYQVFALASGSAKLRDGCNIYDYLNRKL